MAGAGRWKEATRLSYPLERWHQHQGKSNDCGPFCVAIVNNALRDTFVVDAQSVAQEMSKWDRRSVPKRIAGWATFPWGVAGELRRMGWNAHWRVLQSPEHLLENLHRQIIPIIIIGEPLRFKSGRWSGWSHYKVLFAWDPDQGWGFVDPIAKHEGGLLWQADQEFRSLWSNMGRQIIEVQPR